MQREYLLKLPTAVRALAEELEALSGREIRVEVASDSWRERHQRFSLMVNLVRKDNEALILLPKPEVSTQALTHELLHLKRVWKDRAVDLVPHPKLDDRTWATVAEITGNVDEVIEHSFWLIPEEKRLGVFDASIWNKDYRTNLNDSRDAPEGEPRQRWAANNWLAVSYLVTDDELRRAWRSRLTAWGHLDSADAYVKAVADSFPDKRAMLEHVPQHLFIARRYLGLTRYNPTTKLDEVRPF